MRGRNWWVYVLLSLGLASCAGGLQVSAEWRYWEEESGTIDTLLTLYPAVPVTAEPWCTDWLALLTEAAQLNGITLAVLSPSEMGAFEGREVDALTQLRQEVEWALAQQGFAEAVSGVAAPVALYRNAPRLIHDYSTLRWRYVALQGVRRKGAIPQSVPSLFYSDALHRERNLQGMQYYLVVADLERALIIYREVRDMPPRIHCGALKSVLYDSYKYLRH